MWTHSQSPSIQHFHSLLCHFIPVLLWLTLRRIFIEFESCGFGYSFQPVITLLLEVWWPNWLEVTLKMVVIYVESYQNTEWDWYLLVLWAVLCIDITLSFLFFTFSFQHHNTKGHFVVCSNPYIPFTWTAFWYCMCSQAFWPSSAALQFSLVTLLTFCRNFFPGLSASLWIHILSSSLFIICTFRK